jgi:CheY-like chemotaxis protein
MAKPASVMTAGSEVVLIVEDEEAVRRIAERILRGVGYRVLAAASGGDALVLCEKHDGAIDLLLTDVVMPQMNGRELAERLAPLCPRLRTLYMSGYTDNAITHNGAFAPGTRFIGKPFSAADLTRKVREVLDAD